MHKEIAQKNPGARLVQLSDLVDQHYKDVFQKEHGDQCPGLVRVDFYGEVDRVISKYPLDPRRTQQLLEEAGFTKGADGFFVGRDGVPLRLGVWSSSGTKRVRTTPASTSKRTFSPRGFSSPQTKHRL